MTPGHSIACTGSPDSILAVLRAAGIKSPKILVDWSTHALQLQVGPEDDGRMAAKVLWHVLPAGVATAGSESYPFSDSGGGSQVIRISRHGVPCSEQCLPISLVADLLGMEEQSAKHLLQWGLGQANLRWSSCGSCVDQGSFDQFLIHRGFVTQGIPDPLAFYLEHQSRTGVL